MPRPEPVAGDVVDLAPATSDGSLADLLDRVLDKGVAVEGEVAISVADVELIYVGLRVVVSSVERMRQSIEEGR